MEEFNQPRITRSFCLWVVEMAAKPLDKPVVDAIITDWRVGQLSQQAIADKHGVSKGAVNKLCKGIDQDGAPIVTAGIQYRQALEAHDDRIVTAIESAVDERVKRQEWLNIQALQNVKESMAHPCEGQQDFQRRADTILKAKDTVIGKQPDTAIQINNSTGSIQSREEFRAIAEDLINRV